MTRFEKSPARCGVFLVRQFSLTALFAWINLYNISYKLEIVMKTVNFSDARNNLRAVLDRVVDDADVTIITRRDAEDVVVMPLSTWNSWEETEYLLASPANARHLREAIARLDEGKFVRGELAEPKAVYHVNEPRTEYNAAGKVKRATAVAKRKKRG